MSLSASEITKVLEEVGSWCRGARVQDIRLVGGSDLYLELYQDRSRRTLLLSADPKASRLHHAGAPPGTGAPPGGFVQLLRSRLLGGRVLCLSQIHGDRIVQVEIKAGPEPGTSFLLVAELLGTRANLRLVDAEGKILGSLRRSTLLAGGKWAPPKAVLQKPPPPRTFEGAAGSSYSEKVAGHYARFLDSAREDEERSAYRRAAGRETRRLERLEKNLAAELERAREGPLLREKGELLKAYSSRVPARAASFEMESFSRPGEKVAIELDPALSAAKNADQYFQRARRSGRALVEGGRRIEETRSRLALLRAVLEEFAKEIPLADLRARCRSLGLAAPARRAPSGAPEAAGEGERFSRALEKLGINPRRYESESGRAIFVGRTEAENDALTMRFAGPQDYFFHAAGAPGAHVIVCLEKGGELDAATRRRAAELALRYSALAKSGRGEVSYVLRKYVRKRKGDRPGLVHIAGPSKTLWVELGGS